MTILSTKLIWGASIILCIVVGENTYRDYKTLDSKHSLEPSIIQNPEKTILKQQKLHVERASQHSVDRINTTRSVARMSDAHINKTNIKITNQSDDITTLEDSLFNEPYDNDWVEPLELKANELNEKLSLTGNHLSHIDCRTTLCRVEFSHESDDNKKVLLSTLVSSGELANIIGDFKIYPIDNNSLQSVVFFSKKGYKLPVE